jgi:hypothetical protein
VVYFYSSALGKLRGREVKASLGYTERPCLIKKKNPVSWLWGYGSVGRNFPNMWEALHFTYKKKKVEEIGRKEKVDGVVRQASNS